MPAPRDTAPNTLIRRAVAPCSAVAATCARFCESEGLIVRALLDDRIAFCPPLVIGEAEVDELFDRFDRGLARTLDWVKAEGLMAS